MSNLRFTTQQMWNIFFVVSLLKWHTGSAFYFELCSPPFACASDREWQSLNSQSEGSMRSIMVHHRGLCGLHSWVFHPCLWLSAHSSLINTANHHEYTTAWRDEGNHLAVYHLCGTSADMPRAGNLLEA